MKRIVIKAGDKAASGEIEIEADSSEEAEILAEWALHDPLDSKRARLIEMAQVAAQEALIAAKRTQIESMNETALDAAIEAGGV